MLVVFLLAGCTQAVNNSGNSNLQSSSLSSASDFNRQYRRMYDVNHDFFRFRDGNFRAENFRNRDGNNRFPMSRDGNGFSQNGLTPPVSQSNGQTYTLDQVAQHNSESDCWMIIEGKIYNVTDYVSMHPGGTSILQGCGTDATQIFNQRPTDGTSHSGMARRMLTRFYVGDLKSM